MTSHRVALTLGSLLAAACGPATHGLGSTSLTSDDSETATYETDGGSEAGSADGNETFGDGDGDPGDGDGGPGTTTSTTTGDGDGDGDPNPLCGNGMIDPGEQCDEDNLDGNDCLSLDYGGGTLACDPSCQFDTSNCVISLCGNGVIDPPEECDGAAIGDANCIELGEGPGVPSCTGMCTIDVSTCGIPGEGDSCNPLLFNFCDDNLYCHNGICYDGSLGDPCAFDVECLNVYNCDGGSCQ